MSALKRKLSHLLESEEEVSEHQLEETAEEETEEELDIPSGEELDELDEDTPEDEEGSPNGPQKPKYSRTPRTFTNVSAQIVGGGAYKQYFVQQEHMISQASKARAEIIRDHQLQGPSEALLRSIHMLTSHRCYDVNNVPKQNLFRQSALFALGTLVEEMAKHAARKEAGAESNQQDESEADKNDNDTCSSQAPRTSA